MTEATPLFSPATRLDLYAPIHKALRQCMGEVLSRLGRVRTNDDADLREALEALESMLAFNETHMRQEEEFLHPALEARRPGATLRSRREHVFHRQDIQGMRAGAQVLACAPRGAREAPMRRLYLSLARFIADSFHHMDFEETVVGPVFWALFRVDELREMQGQIRRHFGLESTVPQLPVDSCGGAYRASKGSEIPAAAA